MMQHQWRIWKSLYVREEKVEGITIWSEGFCGLAALPQAVEVHICLHECWHLWLDTAVLLHSQL